MPQPLRRPPDPERSARPLWLAIGGLLVSLASYGLADSQIGDVVFWGGAVFAAISMFYWFVQPRHGL